ISSRKARGAEGGSGGDQDFSADAGVLRGSASAGGGGGRCGRSARRRTAYGDRPGSNQAARGVSARAIERSAREPEGARGGERRDHAADWEGGGGRSAGGGGVAGKCP